MKKVFGVLLIILGVIALVTPFTPGSWLVFVGLGMLGIRVGFWHDMQDKYWGKKKEDDKPKPPTYRGL